MIILIHRVNRHFSWNKILLCCKFSFFFNFLAIHNISSTETVIILYCVGVLGPFTSRVYVTDHFWIPICNVLGYWRHRSVCYTSLFTTSLVVTTISFYNVLGPSDIASRSGPGSSVIILGSPMISSSVICVGPSLDLLLLSACWSAFCVPVFILLPLK
jgi:hypothetical protein